ncbi:MAG: hypothetical protein ACK5NN_04150 [Sphingomonadaceae bacterium]
MQKDAQPQFVRGKYWLAMDRKKSGTLRSKYWQIFWYDSGAGRVRSKSTSKVDLQSAEIELDKFYLKHERGATVCPCCGRDLEKPTGYFLVQALIDYLVVKHDTKCFTTVRPRIAHFQKFLEANHKTEILCEEVDEDLVSEFRTWSQKQKVVVGKGKNRKERDRALGTTEGSVRQVIAAINLAHDKKNIAASAKVKALKTTEVSRPPTYRSDISELARMFEYCLHPKWTGQKEWSAKIANKIRLQRESLLRFLQFSVATWCRPDAAHDFSTEPKRKQWDPQANVIHLNPVNRAQTKKHRPVIPAARQLRPLMEQAEGYFVRVKSVRKAFEAMQNELGLPRERETGPKLIRRSMAHLVRRELGQANWPQGKLMLGHQQGDISDLYALQQPEYMGLALRATEAIIDQIEVLVPGAFTGVAPDNITATGAVNV